MMARETMSRRKKTISVAKTVRGDVYTNVATPLAPVWRRRIPMPLTPRAVREEMLAAGDIRLTPLDRLLDDAAADALERYALCEDALRGNARGEANADRVQRSPHFGMRSPVPDGLIAELAKHAEVKKRLTKTELAILAQFCLQQWRHPDAKSDAELGLIVSSAKNKAAAWQHLVAQTAEKLL